MRLHTGQFKFYCDKCKKGFPDITHYNQHMRNHEGLKYHCDYCAKPFSTKHRYQYHLSVHTGRYKFVCELCNKGFNEKQIYYKHTESCTSQNWVLRKGKILKFCWYWGGRLCKQEEIMISFVCAHRSAPARLWPLW